MKLGTLRGRAVLIDGDRALDIGPSVRTVLGQLPTLSKLTVDRDAPRFSADELSAPVPDPRQVFAIGLNYAPHAEEAGYSLPAEPGARRSSRWASRSPASRRSAPGSSPRTSSRTPTTSCSRHPWTAYRSSPAAPRT